VGYDDLAGDRATCFQSYSSNILHTETILINYVILNLINENIIGFWPSSQKQDRW
jgi:hypothetical protein